MRKDTKKYYELKKLNLPPDPKIVKIVKGYERVIKRLAGN